MTKTAAIKNARSNVSAVMPFGGGYVYHSFVKGRGTTQSNPRPYAQAIANRKAAFYAEAAYQYCLGLGQTKEQAEEAEMLARHLVEGKPWMSIYEVLDKAAQ